MENWLNCRVCGRSISVDEVGGWDDINDCYCENCAVKTDIEIKDNNDKR